MWLERRAVFWEGAVVGDKSLRLWVPALPGVTFNSAVFFREVLVRRENGGSLF